MFQGLKNVVQRSLRAANMELVSTAALRQFQDRSAELNVRTAELSEARANLDLAQKSLSEYEFLRAVPINVVGRLIELAPISKSQLCQDLFVLSKVDFKRNGYFVEFGATNGVDLSNSYLLEKEFGWSGLLAEPAACWHNALIANRTAIVERRCVWSRTGERLKFAEVDEAEYSTIEKFSGNDAHKMRRESNKTYEVETVSLTDLLDFHAAPAEIDYLSIDTEGSELDILSAFNFGKYRFRVITCEHNYTPARDKLKALLESNGYRRTLEQVSKFDDWYVS